MIRLLHLNDIKPLLEDFPKILGRGYTSICLEKDDNTVILATVDDYKAVILKSMNLVKYDLTSQYDGMVQAYNRTILPLKVLEIKRLKEIENPKENKKLLEISKDLYSINGAKNISQTLIDLQYKYRNYRYIEPVISMASLLQPRTYFMDAHLGNFLMYKDKIVAYDVFLHNKIRDRVYGIIKDK